MAHISRLHGPYNFPKVYLSGFAMLLDSENKAFSCVEKTISESIKKPFNTIKSVKKGYYKC